MAHLRYNGRNFDLTTQQLDEVREGLTALRPGGFYTFEISNAHGNRLDWLRIPFEAPISLHYWDTNLTT